MELFKCKKCGKYTFECMCTLAYPQTIATYQTTGSTVNYTGTNIAYYFPQISMTLAEHFDHVQKCKFDMLKIMSKYQLANFAVFGVPIFATEFGPDDNIPIDMDPRVKNEIWHPIDCGFPSLDNLQQVENSTFNLFVGLLGYFGHYEAKHMLIKEITTKNANKGDNIKGEYGEILADAEYNCTP